MQSVDGCKSAVEIKRALDKIIDKVVARYQFGEILFHNPKCKLNFAS